MELCLYCKKNQFMLTFYMYILTEYIGVCNFTSSTFNNTFACSSIRIKVSSKRVILQAENSGSNFESHYL